MFEECKKLRILQRYERQELQTIIERFNEVNFEYVCVPNVRSDNDLCFSSKTPRKIQFYADDKHSCMSKNLNMRKQENGEKAKVENTSSHPFSSKVLRFQDINIDSSLYRQKKTKDCPAVVKKNIAAFGSSCERNFLIIKKYKESTSPVGLYQAVKREQIFFKHSFGGHIKLKAAYGVICCAKKLEIKCASCQETPKNVFWKNEKTKVIFCRRCYNLEIKKSCRQSVCEKLRNIDFLQKQFCKRRFCDFYHEHNNSTAAIRIFSTIEFNKRRHEENRLNLTFNY